MKTLRIDVDKLAEQYGITVLWGAEIVVLEDGREVIELRGETKSGR